MVRAEVTAPERALDIFMLDAQVARMADSSRPDLGALGAGARRAAHFAIRAYQLSLSSIFGRHCRHLPTCSDYVDEAIQRHGLWAGGWMGTARLWRCRPWGTSGFDPVPSRLPERANPLAPWRYGRWRGPLICEPAGEGPKRPPK